MKWLLSCLSNGTNDVQWIVCSVLGSKINILNDKKFAYRPGLSTFDAIKTDTSDLYSELDGNKSITSIFIDFRNSF